MRKLGLILVLLLSLSVVAAADFTLSGKITPKSGVTDTITGQTHSLAEFTFSNGDKYTNSVQIAANGLFTVTFDDAGIESTIAASDTVTMNLGTATFAGIPLTTVPKATYSSTAGTANTTANTANSLSLTTTKQGAESNNPRLVATLNTDSNNVGRFWNFRMGNSAIPTVFSWYSTPVLKLSNGLVTVYNRLVVGENLEVGKYLWLNDYDGDETETKIYSRDNVLNIQDSTNIDGDLTVTGDTAIGGDLTVGGDINLGMEYVETLDVSSDRSYTDFCTENPVDICILTTNVVSGYTGDDGGKVKQAGCTMVTPTESSEQWCVTYSTQSNDFARCGATCYNFVTN